jgi:hypothetical protein
MRAEGTQAEGEGEKQSDLTGVRMEIRALRFMVWFVWFSVLEMSKIDGSNSTGGQMMAPRFVA